MAQEMQNSECLPFKSSFSESSVQGVCEALNLAHLRNRMGSFGISEVPSRNRYAEVCEKAYSAPYTPYHATAHQPRSEATTMELHYYHRIL